MKRQHVHTRLDPVLLEEARVERRLRGVTFTSLVEEGLRRMLEGDVQLDPRLVKSARRAARLRGVTFASLVEEGLRRVLTDGEQPAKTRRRTRTEAA